jgi:hypothetical protein
MGLGGPYVEPETGSVKEAALSQRLRLSEPLTRALPPAPARLYAGRAGFTERAKAGQCAPRWISALK